jgi:hypothetical protein
MARVCRLALRPRVEPPVSAGSAAGPAPCDPLHAHRRATEKSAAPQTRKRLLNPSRTDLPGAKGHCALRRTFRLEACTIPLRYCSRQPERRRSIGSPSASEARTPDRFPGSSRLVRAGWFGSEIRQDRLGRGPEAADANDSRSYIAGWKPVRPSSTTEAPIRRRFNSAAWGFVAPMSPWPPE